MFSVWYKSSFQRGEIVLILSIRRRQFILFHAADIGDESEAELV